MRKFAVALLVVLLLGLSSNADAALVFNGFGLIYDSDLNITWYDAAPAAMTWGAALRWASELTVSNTAAGTWRLPTTPGTAWGYTDEGEMGHLYYVELGNLPGGPLVNRGPFANLLDSDYWTDTTYWANPWNYARDFNFSDGSQTARYMLDNLYVLAVHEGNVGAISPVPEPTTLGLLGIGLLGLIRSRGKRRG